ncbi:hypothetical protein AAG570_000807 [Ranatra chinensis]|uniref:Uncharacterized protein n=1 Tax=Ranatra chinensis TaxID=642074 RepID=A0ABD0ZLE7_9HEMI
MSDEDSSSTCEEFEKKEVHEAMEDMDYMLEERMNMIKVELASLKSEIKKCREENQKEAKELVEIIMEIEKRQAENLDSNFEEEYIPFEVAEAIAMPDVPVQDTTWRSELENRLKTRREYAAYCYEQHLMEVEKLCEHELSRIEEQFYNLEPLNRMVSQWDLPDSGRSFVRGRHFEFLEELRAVQTFSSQIPGTDLGGLLISPFDQMPQPFNCQTGAEWFITSHRQGRIY